MLKNEKEAVEVAHHILDSSCARDGCSGSRTLWLLAEDIVNAIYLTEEGYSLKHVIESLFLDD